MVEVGVLVRPPLVECLILLSPLPQREKQDWMGQRELMGKQDSMGQRGQQLVEVVEITYVEKHVIVVRVEDLGSPVLIPVPNQLVHLSV